MIENIFIDYFKISYNVLDKIRDINCQTAQNVYGQDYVDALQIEDHTGGLDIDLNMNINLSEIIPGLESDGDYVIELSMLGTHEREIIAHIGGVLGVISSPSHPDGGHILPADDKVITFTLKGSDLQSLATNHQIQLNITFIFHGGGAPITLQNLKVFQVFESHSVPLAKRVEKGYRWGFGGHEKVDEIKGSGNHYTAQYWEMDPRLAKRWQPDPVVKPHESRYAIFANNPIWFIDPNGADTVQVFKGSGELHNHTKAKGNDVFFMVEKDEKGNINRLNQIPFDEGTLRGVNRPNVKVKQKDGSVEDKKLTLFDIKGDDNATKLFEFFADPENTNVEWTHAKIGAESSRRNIVGTRNHPSKTSVGHYLRVKNYHLREVIHNHPRGNPPSGQPGGKSGDIPNATLYHQKNKSTILKVYIHPDNHIRYDATGVINND